MFPYLLHKAITFWSKKKSLHALYYLVKLFIINSPNLLNPMHECTVKHPQKLSHQEWACAAPSSCFCLCTCVHILVIQPLCCVCGFPHLPESPQLFGHNPNPRPKQIPLAIQTSLQPWSFHMKRGERWPAAERSTGVNVLTHRTEWKILKPFKTHLKCMYMTGLGTHESVLNCYHCCVGSVKAAWSLWAGW